MMDKYECVKAKLSPVVLGLTFGIIKGVWLLVLAWLAWRWGYGAMMVDHVAKFYHGYAASMMGGVYGGLWGLVSGFVFGVIFGYLYNYLLCLCCRKS